MASSAKCLRNAQTPRRKNATDGHRSSPNSIAPSLSSLNSTEVIIIGGGLAGLMAAWQLKVANVDFLLLESRSELGGRVMTKDFSDSSGSHPINVGPRSISTGAKWIHGACSKNPALTLARRYNVATKKMDFDNVAVYRESKDDFCATDDEDCTKPYNKIAKALEDVHENQDGSDCKLPLQSACILFILLYFF